MERLQQIEEIFHQALQREPDEREAFVRQACRDDSDLRRQVVSLLANYDDGDSLDPAATLEPRQSLGPYRIDSFLAAGGMGKVYRATDTRLNRTVAIKVSAARFSERFEREARVIACLNHPNICTLYDVGPHYLVMEFVEGAPLRGPLPLHKAVEYAGQILDALDTAHRKGIVHRDLKPANILLTKQGIKLLDFGLAKQRCSLTEDDATLATGFTKEGQIAGTLQYMSPEQLHGKAADARSDLFSFGCVLYETLSGKRAFEGQSAASVIAAILERDPAPLNLAQPLDRVIKTCLAKNPDDRFQNALDLKRNLAWALEQPAPAKTNRRSWMAGAAAILALSAAGAWITTRLLHPPAGDRVIRFQIGPSETGSPLAGRTFGGGFAMSPDGGMAAFVGMSKGTSGLWIRPLDSPSGRLLPGTEGAVGPFWSADSRSIAFYSGGVLRRFDLVRESASKICGVNGVFWGGSWSNDGRILFSVRDIGMFQVADSGGTPSQIMFLDRSQGDVTFALPQILSNGRFVYTLQSLRPEGVFAGSLTKPSQRIKLLGFESPLSVPGTGASSVASADGRHYLMWIAGTTLVAQQFDPDVLRMMGEPRSLVDPAYEVHAAGNVVLYTSSPPLRQFKWFDRKGKEMRLLGEPGQYGFNRFSPDGRRVATIHLSSTPDIWLMETGRGVPSRLTSGTSVHIIPVWSPDGQTVLFAGGTPFNIFRIRADGTGGEERVQESQKAQVPSDWTRDGRFILYSEKGPESGDDLWILQVTADGRRAPGAKPWPFAHERFNENQGRFSPDSRWVAYDSDESGRYEVYVRPFPGPGEKVPISTDGGKFPQWGPQSGSGGRELFYVSRNNELMVTTVKLGPQSVEPSAPRELFAMPPGLNELAPYEAVADGQRFLINTPSDPSQPLNVIVNWPALLKKRSAAP